MAKNNIELGSVSEVEPRSVSEVEPYELPAGWKWCRLGDFIDIYRGVSYKKDDAHSEKQENDCLIMRGGNIAEGKINIDADNVYVDKSLVSNNQLIKKNDVIIVTSTGSTKVIGRAGISYQNYSDVAFGAFLTLARPNGKAEKAFVNQYFQSPLYRERIRQLASGVNINNIRLEYITESPFPLPPTLTEQQRIVNRIETMFAKLDQAQEKAQTVLDSFETRKATILHKAFTGELTVKWRKEHGVSDDSWEEKRFDEIAEIKSNLVDVAQFQDFPHIAPDNIEKKTGLLLEYHTVAKDKVKSGKHRFYAGQILYSKIRPYLSKVVVVDFDGVCSADMYPIEAKGDTRFLWYQMLSNEFLDKVSNSGSRSVLPKINQKELSIIPMRTCSLSEQQEIVRILDTVMEKESRAKEAAKTVLDKTTLLKKSILARAFRGEL